MKPQQGDRYYLDMNASDTIENVKAKIQEQEDGPQTFMLVSRGFRGGGPYRVAPAPS